MTDKRTTDAAQRRAAPAEELGRLATEQVNPRTRDLDLLATAEVLERINDEDAGIAGAVRAAIPSIARAVELAAERWRRGGRVVLFGAGTSGRLAALDAAELGPTFAVPADRYEARVAGGPQALVSAVEGSEDDLAAGTAAANDLRDADVAFGVAASGRTPFVLAALERARDRGAATIALACVPHPAIARVADVVIVVDTGPEAITGSTRMKAGSAEKLVLTAFSSTLMVKLGKVYGNLMVDVQVTNEKLQQRAVRLVEEATGVGPRAARRALEDAAGEVKIAIVAVKLGLSPEEARERLERTEGNLRRALEEA
jgi:N-acetylmuramic acid 6-phosphate etherase